MTDLETRLGDAVVRIWDERHESASITAFGLVLSTSPRVTSSRFVLARAPEADARTLWRQFGIDAATVDRMTRGRSGHLEAMTASDRGGSHLDPLRDAIAAGDVEARYHLGCTVLEALSTRRSPKVCLLLWLPDARERTGLAAERLNPPELLAGWDLPGRPV